MGIRENLQEIVKNLQFQKISKGETKIKLPTVPDGYSIEFLGADYKQIIDDDGNIHTPLIASKVMISFKVSGENEEIWSDDIEVIVPGKYVQDIKGNKEPLVIPSIREWLGYEGLTSITSQSKIIINSKYENELSKVALIFKEDLLNMVGLDLDIEVRDINLAKDFISINNIYLSLDCTDTPIGNEGYLININNGVTISAINKKGIFYGTRTILQILKQNNNTLPNGYVRDYPRYEKRGFMLDVGRRFSTLEALKSYVKLMAYYKMNDFHVHLNDNEIRFDDSKWQSEYSGFRLECDTYKGLASKDGHYTKKEFGELIDLSDDYCVDIVPEIDTPAHSLAFVQYDETLALGPGKGRDHLDIMKKETYDFVDNLFNEYMDGDNPTFRFKDVHIGTDEYFGTDEQLEAFRYYTDRYLKLIKSKGRTPRLWGNLSRFKGKTPITSDGVIINIWSLDWVDAIEMINAGYKIINSDDTKLYIVPNANYYRNYLDKENLFNSWEPNIFRNEYTIPSGHPQLLGGAFSIWNDIIKLKISEEEIYDRAKEGIQVIGQKLWGNKFNEDYSTFDKICKNIFTL